MQIQSFAGEDWEVITQLPTKRWEFSTAVVDDKVYIIGGSLFDNNAGPFGLSTVEIYDTQTNTWQRGADMPTPRTNAKAAVVNGQFSTDVLVYDTGSRAVEANGKLSTSWGELKAEQQKLSQRD